MGARVLRTIHVGVARRGRWPVKLVRRDPRFAAAAIVDIDHEAVEEARELLGMPDVPAFDDYKAAFKSVPADAAIICTPTELHAPMIRAAFDAGLHVLVEKGMTHSLAEARKLVSRAKKKGLAFCVAENYRYRPLELELHQSLERGRFGRPAMVDLVHHRYRPEPRTLNYPGAVVWDMSCHHFDLFVYFFGRCRTIIAQTYSVPWSAYAHDAAVSAVLEFESGVTVTYLVSHISQSSEYRFVIQTDQGTIHANGPLTFRPRGGDVRKVEPTSKSESEQLVLDHFYRYVTQGVEPGISGRNNLQVMAMCQACLDSAASGKVVDVQALLKK